MKKIFKYPIEVGLNEVHIPNGGKIIHFGFQEGPQLNIWVEVHADMLPYNRKFAVHGTGHNIPEDGRIHVGSCIVGNYVWHLYEVFN